MSFFFDVTDGKNTYRAGTFGGAGTNTLVRDFMEEHNIPESARQQYIDSIQRLKKEKVELFLGNHLPNNHTEEKLKLLGTQEENPFVAGSQEQWLAFLDKRLSRFQKLLEEGR